MKKFRRLLKYAFAVIIILIVAAAIWLTYLARTRLPNLDAEVVHQAIKEEVRVTRDQWGVPHIEAKNEADAYFALGYCMSQDRLFQMELLRRISLGELAEVLGPLAIPVDKIIRSFRFRQTAETAFAKDECTSPEARAAIGAFVAGVNHRIEAEPLPFEYAALHMSARHFNEIDCVCVAGALGISFAEGLRTDPVLTLLNERYPNMNFDVLFPGYSKETPVTIMETLQEASDYLKQHSKATPQPQANAQTDSISTPPVHAFMSAMLEVSKLLGPTLGSNSWILSGSRTKSGKPILANDPHIAFTNPGIWYQAHVKYPGFELYGYYLPPLPLALLGQNRHHAWALTMFENDDIDLYREKFDPNNPKKVMYKGEWTDVKEETEDIKVRFWPDQTCKLRVTPHGSVVTDLFRRFINYDGADIALSWTWQNVPFTYIEAIYRMGRAPDVDSFGQALSLITSPGINVSYVDIDGNTAWWASGRIAIRPDHVNHKTLLDGASGKDEILGYLPWEQNPHLKNPESGCIVTANNQSTVKPLGPIREVQGYWQASDRAARIKQILDGQEKWSIEELQAVQFDDASCTAPAFVATLLSVIKPMRDQFNPLEQQALDALEAWNFRHDVDSIGASIFQVFRDIIVKNILGDELGPELLRSYATVADHWSFIKYAVTDDSLPFWNDITTPAVQETRADILRKTFRDVAATLAKQCGSDVKQWKWGKIHTIEFTHPFGYAPLLGRIFNIGPFQTSGCGDTINSMLFHPGAIPYHVIGGPSTRRLIDYATPDRQFDVLPTGNSGNFMSPNYADQTQLFITGKYRELPLTEEQIKSAKRHEMRFLPMVETIYLK